MLYIEIYYIQQQIRAECQMIDLNGEAANPLVPELEKLLKLWRQRYGARSESKRASLTADDLRPWSRNVALIEHATDGRFYVRGFGIDLIRRFGRESTGHCIDDLARDIRDGLYDSLWRSLSTGAPVAARSWVKLGRDAAKFCDLAVPIVWNAGRVTIVALASYEMG